MGGSPGKWGESCSWFGLNSVRLGRPQGDVLIIVLRRTGSIPVVSNSSFDSSDSLCHMLHAGVMSPVSPPCEVLSGDSGRYAPGLKI